MKLSAPKESTFWISLILAVLGVVSALAVVPVLTGISFWLVVVAFVLLLIGTAAKGF